MLLFQDQHSHVEFIREIFWWRWLLASEPCDEFGLKRGEVDIIIPLYNAYDLSAQCIESVLRNSNDCRLILIDDASSDSRIAALLERTNDIPDKSLTVIKVTNQMNMGFVKTVNRAYQFTRNNFVLLNSDTEVPPGWLDRLFAPIVNDSFVASSTPFSNSATICSFPKVGVDNEMYMGLDVESLDNYFRTYSPSSVIDIPTGVGFCMAFSRKIVEEIGLFDEEAFGRGYGEENDFCMRALYKGYRNVLVTNLFVYHKHGGTFEQSEKETLVKANLSTLLARYPEYSELVQRYLARDPAWAVRNSILQTIDVQQRGRGVYAEQLKIKILLISHSAQSHGAEICLLNLIKNLDKSRFEVVVVFPMDGILKKEIDNLAIRSYIIPMEWWINIEGELPFRGIAGNESFRRLLEVIETERPSIIHTNTAVIWQGAAAAWLTGIPHVWHIHEILEGHPTLQPECTIPLLSQLLGYLSERVVSVSETMRNKLLAFIPEEKLVTIYNGIEPPSSRSLGVEPIREELGLAPAAVVVLTVGTLLKCKGLDTLLDAARLVKQQGADVIFLIAGNGTDAAREALVAKITGLGLAGTVVYLGFREDIRDIMEQVDFLVVPSINESFSLVTVEAMAAGRPVVSTCCGGPSEIIDDGETGYLVPVNDPEMLASRIIDMVSDSDARQRMGERARSVFREDFHAKTNAEHFSSLYSELVYKGKSALTSQERGLCDGLIELLLKNSDRERRIVEFERVVNNLECRQKDLLEHIALQEKTQALLEARVSDLEHLLEEQKQIVDRFESSISWKITAPIRRIIDWARH